MQSTPDPSPDTERAPHELKLPAKIKISAILISFLGSGLALNLAVISGLIGLAFSPAVQVSLLALKAGVLLTLGSIALGLAYRWSSGGQRRPRG